LALTLEDLGKKRKENKLNYNSEKKALPFSPSNADANPVNRPITEPIPERRLWLEEKSPEKDKVLNVKTFSIEEVINLQELANDSEKKEQVVKKGELTKPESKLVKIDRQLEKIETKTSKMIEKDKKQKDNREIRELVKLSSNSTESVTSLSRNYTDTLQGPRCDKSLHDLLSMPSRKIPRQVLNYVKAHAYQINGEWFSAIDSFELSELTGKSAHHLSDAISILKRNGWFDIINSSTSGSRTLRINPEIYGLL